MAKLNKSWSFLCSLHLFVWIFPLNLLNTCTINISISISKVSEVLCAFTPHSICSRDLIMRIRVPLHRMWFGFIWTHDMLFLNLPVLLCFYDLFLVIMYTVILFAWQLLTGPACCYYVFLLNLYLLFLHSVHLYSHWDPSIWPLLCYPVKLEHRFVDLVCFDASNVSGML